MTGLLELTNLLWGFLQFLYNFASGLYDLLVGLWGLGSSVILVSGWIAVLIPSPWLAIMVYGTIVALSTAIYAWLKDISINGWKI